MNIDSSIIDAVNTANPPPPPRAQPAFPGAVEIEGETVEDDIEGWNAAVADQMDGTVDEDVDLDSRQQ